MSNVKQNQMKSLGFIDFQISDFDLDLHQLLIFTFGTVYVIIFNIYFTLHR
jgi:hypothetical protein